MTIDEVIAGVRELAKKYPDNIYKGRENHLPSDGVPRCSYYVGENTICKTPGCIFGQVLTPKYKFEDEGDINEVLDELKIERSEQQSHWCALVQSRQDDKCSWRSAIAYADCNPI